MKDLIDIICESCNTKFRVNIHDIGIKGRFVRCTQCGHEWLEEIDVDYFISKKNEKQDNSIDNDKKKQKEIDINLKQRVTEIFHDDTFEYEKIDNSNLLSNKNRVLIIAILIMFSFFGFVKYSKKITQDYPITRGFYKLIGFDDM